MVRNGIDSGKTRIRKHTRLQHAVSSNGILNRFPDRQAATAKPGGIEFTRLPRHTRMNILQIDRFDSVDDLPDGFDRRAAVTFLERHLGPFGDEPEAIDAAIEYAIGPTPGPGGFCILARSDRQPVGFAVVNRTGMSRYIPPNILVYIAVDASMRGSGIGGAIVDRIKEEATGGIALHVEYDNPARRLYERLGFTSKYAEMRFDPGAE